MTWSERLGRVGVWRGVKDIDPALARTLEELGYGTIWQGGSPGADLGPAEELLDATESLHVATGIVNIWKADPAELASSYHRLEAKHPGRLLLGIGSGHREATTPADSPPRMRDGEVSRCAQTEEQSARRGPGVVRARPDGCLPSPPSAAPVPTRT